MKMSLLDKLNQKEQEQKKQYNSQFWKPKEGDVIEGVVEKMGSTIADYGDQNYLEFIDDSGLRWTVWCNAILDKQIEKEEVKAGSRQRHNRLQK